mmetsp:Transcript_10846/g.28462  ORF Transcript_10846/g.28462 Transcript_10846/m.28462 type:complete len:329 (+) Transcript_10846:446-1432(+)
MEVSLSNLPADILWHICLCLSPSSVQLLAQCSKYFWRVCSDPGLWGELAGKLLGPAWCAYFSCRVDDKKRAATSALCSHAHWRQGLASARPSFRGHSNAVFGCSMYGNKLMSSSGGGEIKVWTVRDHSCQTTLAQHTAAVLALDCCEKSRLVVSGDMAGSVKVWELVDNVDDFLWSQSTKQLKTMLARGGVSHIDCFEKGELVHKVRSAGAVPPALCKGTHESGSGVVAAAILDSSRCLSVNNAGFLKVHNCEDATALASLSSDLPTPLPSVHNANVSVGIDSLVFHAPSQSIFTGDKANRVLKADIERGCLNDLVGEHEGWVWSLLT